MHVMKDYKIYVPSDTSREGEHIPAGVYEVHTDDSTYSKLPSVVMIKVGEVNVWVTIQRPQFCDDVILDGSILYAVNTEFDPDILTPVSEEDMWSDLESLCPAYMLVESYVGWYNSLREAWVNAILVDNAANHITQEQLDNIVYKR